MYTHPVQVYTVHLSVCMLYSYKIQYTGTVTRTVPILGAFRHSYRLHLGRTREVLESPAAVAVVALGVGVVQQPVVLWRPTQRVLEAKQHAPPARETCHM